MSKIERSHFLNNPYWSSNCLFKFISYWILSTCHRVYEPRQNADFRFQTLCQNKRESISFLKVSLTNLICTLIFDSHKRCEVANYGVPGAYLHEDITKDKSILMKIRIGFVVIMCQFNLEYEQQVRYENGGRFCIY